MLPISNVPNRERKCMAIIETDNEVQTPFEQDVAATQRYIDGPRFAGITRLFTARQVVEQRGTIPPTTPWRETRRQPSTSASASSSR